LTDAITRAGIDVLLKPFDLEDLYQRIAHLVALSGEHGTNAGAK
jgi:hypothetical protein